MSLISNTFEASSLSKNIQNFNVQFQVIRNVLDLKHGRISILDSSFNPPTKAHKALLDNEKGPRLLLLATKNADKPKADINDLSHRLVMMGMLDEKSIIAITSCATFVDKSRTLYSIYPQIKQTWILGWDTLIRLFDPKYYGDNENIMIQELSETLFSFGNNLRCAYRSGIEQEKVDSFLSQPLLLQFRDKIDMIHLGNEVCNISSTKARNAALQGDNAALATLVLPQIADYILQNRLYRK